MQTLDCNTASEKNIQLQVLRLDEIHPIVSGNKIFKLHYFLEGITNQTIITFGGAYSNHLAATAFACNKKNIECIGIVRGEEPKQLSHTLQQCIANGMKLHFISREEYDKKETADFLNSLKDKFGNCIIIPEGGYDIKGAKGAAQIMDFIPDDLTHICCAVGTATTIAGLLLKAKPHQTIVAFPALKGLNDIGERIDFLTNGKYNPAQLLIDNNYHFGGYAKKTDALINFMNDTYKKYNLPTDFVYTAKMLYGTMDLMEENFFAPGSNICCIHTGGLQGNLSLPKGTLTF